MAVAALLLHGCESAPSDTLPLRVSEDSLVLNTEWRYRPKWSGAVMSTMAKGALIYSADPVSKRIIRVFDRDGSRKYDVPLDAALAECGGINTLCMLNDTTFFILCERGRSGAIIDARGKIIHSQRIHLIEDDARSACELDGPYQGPLLFSDAIFLGADWVGDEQLGQGNEPVGVDEEWRVFFRQAGHEHEVARLSLSDFSARLGGKALNKRWVDPPRAIVEGTGLARCSYGLIWYSAYSDTLHLLDTISMCSIRAARLTWSKGRVGIEPPEITEQNIVSEAFNVRLQTEPAIACVLSDPSTNRLAVVIMHKADARAARREKGVMRAWSLIALDSAMNVIAEYEAPGGVYQPDTWLSLDDGIWVLEQQQVKTIGPQRHVFKRILL